MVQLCLEMVIRTFVLVVAKVSSLKKDIKKLEIMHFKENNCVPNTEEYIHLLKLHKKAKKLMMEWHVGL